jgi:hypothetical protein
VIWRHLLKKSPSCRRTIVRPISSDDVIRLGTEVKVRVITFALHTTQIFQALDLTLFGVLKRLPRYEPTLEDDTEMVNFIRSLCNDFRQMIAPSNIWEAFRALALELEFDARSEPCRLFFDEEARALGKYSPLAFPWIGCPADDASLGSVGSTDQSKMIYISVFMFR